MTNQATVPAAGALVGDRPGGPPLLTTKLIPPRPLIQVVHRRRLIDAMSAAVSATPLTLISAPAGAGKTILAAAWAAHPSQTHPVAWLTLDDRDNQPGVLWSHVLDALAHNGVVPASTTRPTRPDSVDPSFIERLAADILASEHPVVVVLDNAERLRDRQVAEELELLLRSAVSRLRLVMVTRADPVLPMHRYRLEGTVTEIRHDDLAFTAAEVKTMLELHGVDAAKLTAQTLLDRTEGWVAGVRLAALALQHRPAGSTADEIEACLGPRDSVLAEYLIAEVLQEMPTGTRDFLLRTSMVSEIFPGLADELTGRRDSEQVLMELSRRNTFVHHVHGSPGCYRMHSLFRRFLQAWLTQEAPTEAVEMHRRASRWYAISGQVAEAADHAVAAGDWVEAARLVVDGMAIGSLLLPPTTETGLAHRMTAIPDDVDSPEASVVRAALALARGDLECAQASLDRSEQDPISAGSNLSLAVAITSARLGSASQDIDVTLKAARHALDALRVLPDEQLVQHQDLQVLVSGAKGTAHVRAGDFDAACASLARALVAAAADGCEAERLRCLAMLALAEACRGRLSRGQELADTAESFAVESGVAAAHRPAAAHLAHAWVALERQDLAGAQRWLARAARIAETRHDTLLASVFALLRIRLRRDRGDVDGARRLLSDLTAYPPWLRRSFDAERAALDVASGRHMQDAGSDVSMIAAESEDGVETPSAKVAHLLVQAHRHFTGGDVRGCRSAVVQAMALAEHERIRRPFAHVPQQIRRLIRTDPAVSAHADWLRPDRVSSTDRQSHPADLPHVDQALSEKELEALRHLSALLTTEEIAAAMFISVNTVKTHIRSILRKLSVSKRNEAVRRARQLGII